MANGLRSSRTRRFRIRLGIACALFVFVYQVVVPWYCASDDALPLSTPSRSELDDLLRRADVRLGELQKGYDRAHLFNTLNIDLGPSVSFVDYAASLERAANDVFSFASTSRRVPLNVRRVVQTARAASALHSTWYMANSSRNDPVSISMPQRIGSTIKNVEELPEQFAAWKLINPNWDVTLFDDDVMEEWLNARLSIPGAFGSQMTGLLEAYNRMPRPILKADFFRYLLVFFDGGLYTDSDTSCIHSIDEWGKKGTTQDWTDKEMLQLTNQAQALSQPAGSPDPLPINEAPPALIISLESSVDTTTYRWRDQANTGGQVIQWTFGGKPGHPVLLDLIQRIVEVSREVDGMRAMGDNSTWMDDNFVFKWTGPTIWSSAVWRYLWARWGFDFRRLRDVTYPVRVGDVLIFPYASFSASFSELDAEQPVDTCVWHGYFGWVRWRSNTAREREEREAKEVEKKKEKEALANALQKVLS